MDLARIFRHFPRIFNKSKLLGVHLHPLYPRLIHHSRAWQSHAHPAPICVT